ncbi:MAG: PH domain-containing protein [Clostridia bacterium]|nr:PH domain-containing protein [Clostridia bacterium]
MEFKKLDNKAKFYWLTINLIIAIILLALALIVYIFTNEAFLIPVLFGVILPLVLISALIIIYPFLKYRFYKYSYNEEKVIICYGVIFRHKIIMPICQIQDLHIYQGPIMSRFKLSGIIFSTAGSNHCLRCLDKKLAEEIVEEINGYLKKRLEVVNNEEIQ